MGKPTPVICDGKPSRSTGLTVHRNGLLSPTLTPQDQNVLKI
ncbi:MAG: hypothetical protein QNJ51_21680 [Calothrix sp. MO_167.B12]|nr:hypothetical protein [Calothrix sp. MO_167.B12]